MSILSVFHVASPALAYKVLTHHDDIAATLAEQGVRFARWASGARLRPGCAADDVLEACRGPLDHLMSEHRASSVAVLSRDGSDPSQADLRQEHVHDSDEVFAQLTGRAQLSLRLGDYVFAVLCEKDDVLIVPAGTRRWIDLGDSPFCLAVRLFTREQGVEPRFTGDDTAAQFPGIDEF